MSLRIDVQSIRLTNLQLDEVKDRQLVYRSTVEMKSIYKSIRMADPRYVCSFSDPRYFLNYQFHMATG